MNTAKPYVLGPMEPACPHKSPRSILLTLDAHIAAHTGIAHMTSSQAFALSLSTANTAKALFYKRLATALSKVGR